METLGNIMKACVIMHNMIVEDEGVVDPTERFDYGGQNVEPSHESNRTLDEFIEAHKKDQRQGNTPPVKSRPHRAPLAVFS